MTKILLVEDDKSLREIYGVRLLAEGYDIVSAGDGEEALAMAIKERPQLIVSDVMMPKISGFDMLDILRSTTETRDIKVIMMTALSSEDQRARGEALGADRYLVKSQVGIEDVVRTVHDVLGDAPVSSSTPSQTFGGAQPLSAVTRPAPAPTMPSRPTPTPYPSPQQSQPQFQQPQSTTAPQPQQQPQFQQPQYQQPQGLPQPTAPFSTNRPANLGDRIIHPLTQQNDQQKPDLSSLIDQELSQASEPTFTPPTPPTPPRPPELQPVQQPQQQQQQQSSPAATQQQAAPAAQQPLTPPVTTFTATTQPVFAAPQPQQVAPQPQPSALHGASDISFEETPRQPSNPFGSNTPQPPSF